jgi:NAD(P)-dependent dehydrogenase (short-subunit alcohol dehydrogenase family)
MPRSRFDDRSVLVTGAGSGIGRETALLFAARGATLFLCDVDESGLTETAQEARRSGGDVHADVVDVSRRDAMSTFAAAVHQKVAAVDVLVNNAGVGLSGGVLDTELDDWEWVISINLWGVIHGLHYFVPPMVRRKKGGHVVNVASAAGFMATPDLAAYGTTKYAVVGLSEALRGELFPHGIGVSVICPGIINTPIVKSARLKGSGVSRDELVDLYKRRNYGPEKVASAILGAVIKNRAIVPVTPEAWVTYSLKRALPETLPGLVHRVLGRGLGRARSKKGAGE